MRSFLATVVAAIAFGAGSVSAQEDYPAQPITIVVPFSAGGPTDTVTRLIAEPMSQTLGQQIVVQNVTGAGGTLGAGEVAQAEPDGYTVLMHHIGMSTAPSLYSSLPYDPLEDFESDRPRHRSADDHRRAARISSRTPAGADRLREGERREGHLRQCRHRRRLAALRPALHGGDRHEGDRGALPGHRPGADRPGRRPGRLHVRPDHQHDRARSRPARSRPTPITSPERNPAPAGPADHGGRRPRRTSDVSIWHGLYAPKGTPTEVIQKLTAALQDGACRTRRSSSASPSSAPRRSPTGSRHAGGASSERLQSQIELWKPIIEAAGVQPQ